MIKKNQIQWSNIQDPNSWSLSKEEVEVIDNLLKEEKNND